MGAIIQPIMAAFRPHPGDSGRKIFNWAHWGVGNMAYVFGICAIYLAGTLSNANLSSTKWWNWMLLGYVVLHVLTHLIFSVLWAKANLLKGLVPIIQCQKTMGGLEFRATIILLTKSRTKKEEPSGKYFSSCIS